VVHEKGARGLFYDVRDLLRIIRSTYNPVVRTAEMDVLRPVMEAELLVLDDLGAEKPSEWVEETINLIVNTRYNERRPTIFTTNYEDIPDEADLESLRVRVGFRLHSRLHEMCEFLEYDGGDYRMLPANSGPTDLANLWKRTRGRRTLPARTQGPARAQMGPGEHPQAERHPRPPRDLKWPGGKAGH
jgi:DNA replication protein DnaC